MKNSFWILFTLLILLQTPALFAAKTETNVHSAAERDGFYLAITTGEVYFSGADKDSYKNAWMVGLKGGYDFFKYVGIEAQWRFSGHNAANRGLTSANPPPESFFVHQIFGLLKGQYPITKRFYIEGGAGGGFWYSTPNQRPNVGSATRGLFVGTLGLQYFLRIRGLSAGLDPTISGVQNLKSAIYQLSGFIRYTF